MFFKQMLEEIECECMKKNCIYLCLVLIGGNHDVTLEDVLAFLLEVVLFLPWVSHGSFTPF